jgi:hypothetical protein
MVSPFGHCPSWFARRTVEPEVQYVDAHFVMYDVRIRQ